MVLHVCVGVCVCLSWPIPPWLGQMDLHVYACQVIYGLIEMWFWEAGTAGYGWLPVSSLVVYEVWWMQPTSRAISESLALFSQSLRHQACHAMLYGQ